MQRHRQPLKAMSDINVTNLLDTAFILIVVLMVVAPLMKSGLKLDLPQAVAATPSKTDVQKIIMVSVQAKQPGDSSEHILADGKIVSLEQLLERVQTGKTNNPDITVQVEADKSASYGAIFSVLDVIKQAGVDNVDLSSQPTSREPDKKKDEQK